MRALHDSPSGAIINAFAHTIDGQRIDNKGGTWIAQLHGAHPDEGGWWLQITARNFPYRTLLVRTPHDVTAETLFSAVQQWEPARAARQTILTTPTVVQTVEPEHQIPS